MDGTYIIKAKIQQTLAGLPKQCMTTKQLQSA